MLRTVDGNVAYCALHASRGKAVRAEPIAALYEQGRIQHVGLFPELEEQMCAFVPVPDGGTTWKSSWRIFFVAALTG